MRHPPTPPAVHPVAREGVRVRPRVASEREDDFPASPASHAVEPAGTRGSVITGLVRAPCSSARAPSATDSGRPSSSRAARGGSCRQSSRLVAAAEP